MATNVTSLDLGAQNNPAPRRGAKSDIRPMDEEDMGAICATEIQNALGNIGGTVSFQRDQALRYYLGLPFGNEEDGRSQVIMTEVRDAIEGMLPGLMKIFVGGDEIVRFDPQGPEDEKPCKQATEYLNYILMRDNPGFKIIYTWQKDALLSKVGVVKWWWDTRTDTTEESYYGMSEPEFAQLLSDETVEPLQHTATPGFTTVMDPNTGQPMQMPAMLHDVKVRRTKKQGRVNIENVPPEEFLISRDGTDVQNARFVGHRITKTVSELIAMGFPEDLIAELPTEDLNFWTGETVTRRARDDETGSSIPQAIDPAMRRVTVIEGYYRVDYDGDGVAELRQVWSGSMGKPILRNEVFNGPTAPFATKCPVPMPHRFFGLSLADQTIDSQEIKSTLVRQVLDNMYHTNNAGMEVIMPNGDEVNLDDLLTNRPGRIVRTRTPGGALKPIETKPLGPEALPLIEYIDSVIEKRTGVTKYSQGLNPDALENTATGANIMTNFAMDRQLMIARIFAETGFKDLFRGLLALVLEHQSEPRVIKLANDWVPMDPREWAHLRDCTISVGLGTGSKMEQNQQAMALLTVQKNIAQGGLTQIVGPKEIYNAAVHYTTTMGFKTADPYFHDPMAPPDKDHPPQQAPADPKMIEVQGRMAAAQADQQIKAQESQQRVALAQWEAQQRLEMERQKILGQMELERQKAMINFQLDVQELKAETALKAFEIKNRPLPQIKDVDPA